MGILDDITGKAQEMMGGSGGGIVKAAMNMLSDKQTGGLHGLVESFRQKGLGEIVNSWIGKGPNAPISPQQVKEGLGPQRMEKVAADAGVSTDEAANKLSEHLPNVVDKLTPEGSIPEGGMLEKGIEMLKSRFS